MQNLNDFYDDNRYGIPSGTSNYTYLQGQISKMEKLVQALNEFHDQTHGLDTNHQNQVSAFRDTVMSLYEEDPPFQGQAADTLFKLLLDYLDTEHAFTGYPGDTSPQLATATTYGRNTAAAIEQQLQALYNEADSYAYTLDKDRNVPEWLRPAARLFGEPPDSVLDANCVLPPSTIQRVENMQMEEWSWGNNMDNLGEQPPPRLPQEPTDPTKFVVPRQYLFYNDNIDEDLLREWEAGTISEEEFDMAVYLHSLFPNLTLADRLALARAIASGRLNLNTVINYLYRLCGGMPGIGNLLVNALANGDAKASTLLDKIIKQADVARGREPGNAVGAQRVMTVLRMLGLDNVADISQTIPGSDGDIVLNDGTGIEVGGVAKGGNVSKFITQLNKYMRAYKRKVQVYLEDDGSQAAKDAIAAAQNKVEAENVHTFSASDRMCI